MTKKDKIIQIAGELFWKHGFKKVSIDEICKKSQVSRKTFYTYYENKNALVIALMKMMTDSIFRESEAIIAKEIPFAEKLKQLLVLKYASNKDFSMEFITDFFHPDSEEILNFFKELTSKSINITRNFYQQAQAKGEMNPELNIDFVMWMMQKQLEIISSDDAIAMFSDADTLSKQLSQLIVYGIMPVHDL